MGSRWNAAGVARSSGRYWRHSPSAPRKVGTPLAAEMPAPVRTVTRDARRRCAARSSSDIARLPELGHGRPRVMDTVEQKFERPVRLRAIRDLGTEEQHAALAERRIDDRRRALEVLLAPRPPASQWRGGAEPCHTPDGRRRTCVDAECRAAVEKDVDVASEAEGHRSGVIDGDPQDGPRNEQLV